MIAKYYQHKRNSFIVTSGDLQLTQSSTQMLLDYVQTVRPKEIQARKILAAGLAGTDPHKKARSMIRQKTLNGVDTSCFYRNPDPTKKDGDNHFYDIHITSELTNLDSDYLNNLCVVEEELRFEYFTTFSEVQPKDSDLEEIIQTETAQLSPDRVQSQQSQVSLEQPTKPPNTQQIRRDLLLAPLCKDQRIHPSFIFKRGLERYSMLRTDRVRGFNTCVADAINFNIGVPFFKTIENYLDKASVSKHGSLADLKEKFVVTGALPTTQ